MVDNVGICMGCAGDVICHTTAGSGRRQTVQLSKKKKTLKYATGPGTYSYLSKYLKKDAPTDIKSGSIMFQAVSSFSVKERYFKYLNMDVNIK